MNGFQRKVEEFFTELGVSERKIKSFLESDAKDYRSFLNKKGARKLNYQRDLRNSVRHRGLVLTEEKLVITSVTPNGDKVALAQELENGQITFPSEGIVEWLYSNKHTAIEPPVLAAYHKLFEIVGNNIDLELEYFGEKTTTIVSENKDIVYCISLFYEAYIPYEVFERVSRNKKWKVISITENGEY